MSSWSGDDKRSASSDHWKSGKNWRGKQAAPGKADYAWQEGPAGRVPRGPGKGRRWEAQWRWYALLGIGMLGVFLALILYRPAKTPLLMVTATGYVAPIPANAWAMEDLHALEELQATLAITPIAGSWIGPQSEARAAFRERLGDHRALRRGFRKIAEPLVVYFSMPGVVDRQGVPCLLPPGASPFRSDDWVTIESIVADLAEAVPDERAKLLVLDCNQVLVNWDMGIVYNTFTERLKRFVADCRVPNLAVLTAADEGQSSWTAPQMGGTAFGQHFRLGLAGAADREGVGRRGMVSVRELGDYLAEQVDRWSQRSRAARQQPILLMTPGSVADFDVARALKPRDQTPYRESVASVKPTQPTVSIKQLGELWSQLDGLQRFDVLRYNPLAWATFQDRLLRLEELAFGGESLGNEARRVAAELKERLDQASSNAPRDSLSVTDYWKVTNPDDAASILITQPLRSLPLREYFGQSDHVASQRMDALWRQLAAPIPLAEGATADSDPALVRALLPLAETQFLVAAQQQRVREFAENSTDLLARLEMRLRAEQLAVPGSRGGGPGDERAHYYVRMALNAADAKRRLAEDALFVDAPPSAVQNQWQLDADKLYDTTETVRDQMTEVLATCDLIWAEVPYLAQWVCQPAVTGSTSPTAAQVNELLNLIRDNHELGEAIDSLNDLQQAPQELDQVTRRLVVRSQDLQRRHKQLREELDTACGNLGQGAIQDGAQRLALEAALGTPLVRSELRSEMLKQRGIIEEKLHREHFGASGAAPMTASTLVPEQGHPVTDTATTPSATPAASTTTSPKVGADGSQTVAERIARWSLSPLLAVLQPQPTNVHRSGSSQVIDRLEEDCWSAREQLLRLTSLNVRGADSTSSAAADNAYLNDRLALSRAARSFRSAAPLWFEPPRADPVARLRRLDLQELLLWHAERTLLDFWHTVTGPDPKTLSDLLAVPAPSIQPPIPHFESAADEYLRAAEQINNTAPPGVALQVDALKRLLERRRDASSHGLLLQASSEPVPDAPADIFANVTVTADPKGPDLPPGLAAVYIGGEQGRLLQVTGSGRPWGSVPLPLTPEAPQQLAARAKEVSASNLSAVAFFRGRQYRRPFVVNKLGGAVVEYEPPRYDRQSVALYGDQPSPPSVVFILDCSDSMRAEIKTEVPGAPLQPRMVVAKSALNTMLDELSKRRSQLRIGLRLFGHRVAWTRQTVRYVRNPSAPANSIPNNLSPAEDVELILPLGAFGAQQLGEVSERMKHVTPFGLTPVYLAIMQALDDFTRDDDQLSKSIIVITDGKNDQFDPPNQRFQPVRPTTYQQVIAACANKEIAVHIVGFGIPEGEEKAAVEEFKTIAERTGGVWTSAESGADLIDSLRKQLRANGYLVRDASGRSLIRDQATGEEVKSELNTVIDVPASPDRQPFDLEVSFQDLSAAVTIEGGEALKLQVNRDGDQITAMPYDDSVVAEAELVRGSSATPGNLLLRVHRPKRNRDLVRFRLSVQALDSHFTPRPKELWIEVTPEGSQDPYLFYDPVYEPNTPVPVAAFTASNWPPGVDNARVRFWCKNEPTPPVQTIALSDVWRRDFQLEPFRPVPSVAGVGLRVGVLTDGAGADRRYRVRVEERYQGNSASFGAVRVWIDSTDLSLQPQSVGHLFDARHNFAMHQFQYAGNMTQREFAGKVRVRVAAAEAIKQDALQLDDASGLKVRIVDEDATLLPNATPAVQ